MESSQRKFQLTVLLLLLAILGSIFYLAYFSQDDSVDSVAYVNLEKVFAEHPAKNAAEEELNQKAAEYQLELEEEAESLAGSEQKKLLQSYQLELQHLESELLKSVLKEVEAIIIETAEAKKVKFVLESEDVLYGGYNLTDDVLNKIEAEW